MNTKRPRTHRSKNATRARPLAPPVKANPQIAIRDQSPRLDIVDAARGAAMAMMIAYHFCFDLTVYGWARWAMLDDPRWVAWRTIIVASFLVLVGVSLALRDAREPTIADRHVANRAFVRRWLQVAAAALIVTTGSALLFPESFIYFGVLHFVAVALWICRRAPRMGAWAVALGIAAIALGVWAHDSTFDPRSVNWIGFAEHKPITEDYVPLLPWVGVVLIGCGLGALWTRRDCRLSPLVSSTWRVLPRHLRILFAASGRWSLTIYLVHQPILFGAMALIKRFA